MSNQGTLNETNFSEARVKKEGQRIGATRCSTQKNNERSIHIMSIVNHKTEKLRPSGTGTAGSREF
jgi:hypothetical protein